ncbi:MAG TPA: ankyrin repeat domain-containing protein, partial [Methylotenera sp.]|nr:ankyrin repeat domain-containing protein [Methylotenera sp.]
LRIETCLKRAALVRGSMADAGSRSAPSSINLISPALNRRAIKRTVSHSGFHPQGSADLDYQHPMTRWTAFHHAAFDGNVEMVKFLAEKGADVNKKMRGDVDIIRAVSDIGNTKMVEVLKSLGVQSDGCMEEKCL